MKLEYINLAVELRETADELEKIIDGIKADCAAEDVSPFTHRLPNGQLTLATPIAARGGVLAALANLELA